MPTRRMFDLTVIVVVASHPVIGLVRMGARRWHVFPSGNGILATVGAAIRTSLGG